MARELVGVLLLTGYEGEVIKPFPSLKREALFYDRLAVPGLNGLMKSDQLDDCVAADLAWLAEKGFIWEPRVDYANLGRAPILRPYAPAMMMTFDVEANTCLWLNQQACDAVILCGSNQALAERFPEHLDDPDAQETLDLLAEAASMMNSGQGSGAMIINDRLYTTEKARHILPQGPPVTGLEVVVNQFPEPDEMTSWERIGEFRADSDARESLHKFRHWIRKCGREGLSGVEVAEEMQDLLADFDRHMKIHKMKTNVGLLQGVIVGVASMIENLAKLKFEELAKLPFSSKHRKLANLEAELNAPGREVAYVAKTREWFGRR